MAGRVGVKLERRGCRECAIREWASAATGETLLGTVFNNYDTCTIIVQRKANNGGSDKELLITTSETEGYGVVGREA